MFKAKGKIFGCIFVAIAAIVWGSEAVLAKLCYQEGFNSFLLLFMRGLVGAILFNISLPMIKAPFILPKGKRLFFLLLISVQCLGQISLYMAFSLLSPALAILFFYFYPSLACLIAVIVLKERLDLLKIGSLVISLIGLLLLYWTSMEAIALLGVVFSLISAICQAININCLSRFLPQVNVNTYNANQTLVLATIYGVFCLSTGQFAVSISLSGWIYAVILGFLAVYIANLCFNKGVSVIGPVDTAIIALLEPPTTVILSFLIFGEVLSFWQSIGAFFIVMAVAMPQIKNYFQYRVGINQGDIK